MNQLKKIDRYWSALIGKSTLFSMESRIFNAVCVFAMLTASLNGIINICLGLVIYAILVIPLVGVLFLCYYLSRYKGKLNLAVGIAAISFNLLCGATYFAAEASNGVNLFTFILIIFILALVSSKKQFWIWIPLNMLLLLILFAIEYLHPELVGHLYVNARYKFLDVTQTFFEVVFMIALITFFIKRSYNREKELAESRLIALEESNETKNKLFSVVAHDLKAPLASIENYLSILNQIELATDEKITIEKNLLATTRQTSAMLHNILLWSKDQMEGISTNLIPIFVHQTLAHTIQFQLSLAKEKGIKLNYEPNLTIQAIADPDMLQLIVRNILNNAIKFSSPGGKIDLNISEKGKECLIAVSDNGIGIKLDQQLDIFSLKSKGTYGTNNEKGVGLGLKLTKAYVELQNGKIWFESNIGSGTTFYISLPKA